MDMRQAMWGVLAGLFLLAGLLIALIGAVQDSRPIGTMGVLAAIGAPLAAAAMATKRS